MSAPDGSDGAAATRAAPATRYVPGSGEQRRHVLVAIVNNRPGVLNRVASLMRARSYNIESLAVGHTENPEVSRMTITLRGDDYGVEQVSKQLYRLIDVLKVQDVTAERRIEHELALIKLRASNANRGEIVRIVEMAKGRVVDLAVDSIVFEATGPEEEIDRLVELVTLRGDDYGVEQVSKQLYRLIDVLKVQDVTAERRIEHELALIKVRASNANRGEIVQIVEMAKGRVVDLAADSVVFEATGPEEEIDRLVELVTPFGIKELVRTGSVVMLRGAQVTAFEEKS